MSKVGKAPITIPQGVTLQVKEGQIEVKGPKGTLTFPLMRGISIDLKDGQAEVKRAKNTKEQKALHGLTRSTLASLVQGVETPYTKVLELVGTGYRARLQGNKLVLALGFSHDIEYPIPPGIEITLEGNNLITVKGPSKHLVGQVAANIRDFKKPEPYKGKGIKYQDEVIRRKAGKAAKTAAA